MELTQEILRYAQEGIMVEIRKHEEKVRKGKKLLADMKDGSHVPQTKKTPNEIKEIIAKAREQIEILDKKRFDLSWEESLME